MVMNVNHARQQFGSDVRPLSGNMKQLFLHIFQLSPFLGQSPSSRAIQSAVGIQLRSV